MSYSPSHPSPAPPLSRASLVLGLYGAMALVSVIIAAARGNPDVFRLGDPPLWMFGVGPLVGVALGLVVVVMWRVAIRRFAWARDLKNSFRDVLGALTGREILILAAASSVGEELLFRGALLPWLGLWWQAILFGLPHIGPKRRFLPWTAFALVLGVALGAMAQWTGNLGGPIAAHFIINFLNLRFIVRDKDAPQPRAPAS
jgi:uncharacterized protein